MPALYEEVANKFMQIIKEKQEFDQIKLEKLEDLIRSGQQIKPDDLVAIFSLPDGGEVL